MTNSDSGRTEGSEVQRLRATERERLRALVSGDVARAAQLHADEFQLINPLGGALSKDEYLGGISSGQIQYLQWEPEAIAVRVYGDAAGSCGRRVEAPQLMRQSLDRGCCQTRRSDAPSPVPSCRER